MHEGQTQYQVRFEWGIEGARAIANDADLVIVVDALTPDAANGERVAAALEGGPTIVAGSLRNRAAVACQALDAQTRKGERFMIAVVAAGEEWSDGRPRFAVEDLLAAGSIIDALGELGIDYCSPEAAAASAAYGGLRNATRHLVTASASGRALAAAGRREDLDHATAVDADS